MTYWSGEKLKERNEQVELIERFDPDLIDCASYPLRVGREAFISKDLSKNESNRSVKELLTRDEDCVINIPPGQFAFLLTYETVTIPKDAIAFISVKAKQKFKGLVNVSGFHVDPGYEGKLIFAVYNAGASSVILKYLDPVFLIFFADLDRESSYLYKGSEKPRNTIDSDLIQGMTGQVFSPLLLQRNMEALVDKQNKLEVKQEGLLSNSKIVIWILSVSMGVIFTLFSALISSDMGKVLIGGWINDAVTKNTEYKKELTGSK